MPKCTDGMVGFGKVGRRVVQAALDGGDIVSDGGSLLLRQADERIGLTRTAAAVFEDKQAQGQRSPQRAQSACAAHLRPVLRVKDVTDTTRCATTWCCRRP